MSAVTALTITGELSQQWTGEPGTFAITNRGPGVLTIVLQTDRPKSETIILSGSGDTIRGSLRGVRSIIVDADVYPTGLLWLFTPLLLALDSLTPAIEAALGGTITIAGTVSLAPGTAVDVTDRPARQLGVVSGSVGLTAGAAVDVTDRAARQLGVVSGSVGLTAGAAVDVTDRAGRAVGVVSLTAGTGVDVTDRPARQLGVVSGSVGLTAGAAVDVTDRAGRAVGVVSAASLPLPTGAATSALQGGGLPAALVGGRLDANLGAWLGSTAPTVGQKAGAASIPVVPASDVIVVATAKPVAIGPTSHVAGTFPVFTIPAGTIKGFIGIELSQHVAGTTIGAAANWLTIEVTDGTTVVKLIGLVTTDGAANAVARTWPDPFMPNTLNAAVNWTVNIVVLNAVGAAISYLVGMLEYI